jgi:tryptophan halogenase
LFRSRGRIFREDEELFVTANWVAVFLGQNIWPEHYDPIADALDEQRVSAAIERMRQAYEQTALQMPTHGQFIARHCAAPPTDVSGRLEKTG